MYNPSSHVAHYSYKMFECEGIPCHHMLCVLKDKGLREFLSYCILNRWTKRASSELILDMNGILLEGCFQIVHENPLVSNNLLEFLDYMEIAGRVPQKNALLLGKEFNKFLKN